MQRIDARELSEWIAYARLEPFGEDRADLRAGIIASTMANAWRGKGSKAHKPSDFMPKFGKPERQTPEEMKAAAQRIAMTQWIDKVFRCRR